MSKSREQKRFSERLWKNYENALSCLNFSCCSNDYWNGNWLRAVLGEKKREVGWEWESVLPVDGACGWGGGGGGGGAGG